MRKFLGHRPHTWALDDLKVPSVLHSLQSWVHRLSRFSKTIPVAHSCQVVLGQVLHLEPSSSASLESFSRGTAPGPMGLRAQHLTDAVRSVHGDEALEQLTSLCNLLARGDAPQGFAEHLAGASLMAFQKPD